MPGKVQKAMREIYPPSYDLCLAKKECRPYRSPLDAMQKLGKESDSHYHLKRSCVANVNLPYKGEDISIPSEVAAHMTRAQKNLQRKEFG